MSNYTKTQVSPNDATKLAILSILRAEDDLISGFGQKFRRTVSFDDFVHLIDDENIMNYVDLDFGITIYPKKPTKFKKIIREHNYSSRSSEKPICIPSNDQDNCFIYEQHGSKIFLNPYNLWDTIPAALTSLNCTNDRYSMSNQCPQATTHQPRTDSYPGFSSLRAMDSRRKDVRVSFAFFHRSNLPDGRVNETIATVDKLNDLWKCGAMDGIPPFVMNCNCF